MTDEAFGGNVSGVAMEFKLLGMENITKIKTRYYRKGLRKRLRIFANFLSVKGMQIDISRDNAYLYESAAEEPSGIEPDCCKPLGKGQPEDAAFAGAVCG